nr:hypothetical protein CFP56_78862 [Quercus suber]
MKSAWNCSWWIDSMLSACFCIVSWISPPTPRAISHYGMLLSVDRSSLQDIVVIAWMTRLLCGICASGSLEVEGPTRGKWRSRGMCPHGCSTDRNFQVRLTT